MKDNKKKNDCLYEFGTDLVSKPVQTRHDVDNDKIETSYEYGTDFFIKNKKKKENKSK